MGAALSGKDRERRSSSREIINSKNLHKETGMKTQRKRTIITLLTTALILACGAVASQFWRSVEASVVAPMATINITSLSDSGPGSLREAINQANANPGADTISLPAGMTITITTRDSQNDYGFNGLPSITSQITIEGNGATIARGSAAGTPSFRLFHVAPGGNLTLRNVVLSNGLAQGGKGGFGGIGGGGGASDGVGGLGGFGGGGDGFLNTINGGSATPAGK